MLDFAFDAFSAYNAMLFLFGALVFILIGGGLIAYWIYWRLASVRVKGRIVGVKSTGARRSATDWQREYQGSSALGDDPPDTQTIKEAFAEDFRQGPVKTVFASLIVMLFVLMPFGFFLFGAWSAYDVVWLKLHGYQAQGTITGYETTYDSESGTIYYPVVRYTDQHGDTYQEEDRLGTGSEPFAQGQKIGVYYDPDDPARFVLDTVWRYMTFSLAFMGIGGLFVGFMAFGLIRAQRDEDTPMAPAAERRKIAAIKRKYYNSQYYTPVYEFQTPQGDRVQADGDDDSSNWLADKLPGRQVTLMVIRGKDGTRKVKRPGKLLLVFGTIFLAPGLVMLHNALLHLSFNLATVLLVLAALGFAGFRLRQAIIDNRDRFPSMEDIRDEFKGGIKVETTVGANYLMTPAEIRERVRILDRNALLAVLVMFFFGVGITFAGYTVFQERHDLSGVAMVAQGEVTGLKSRRTGTDANYVYYPVIAFKTWAGERVSFEGKTGSNPPLRQAGDKVVVLYDPDDPERAMIDKGFMNWLEPLALFIIGLLFLYYAMTMTAGITGRAMRR